MGTKASAATTQPINITAEQVQRAQLTVARFSRDADDCALLLDMLGLDKPPKPVPGSARWYRGCGY